MPLSYVCVGDCAARPASTTSCVVEAAAGDGCVSLRERLGAGVLSSLSSPSLLALRARLRLGGVASAGPLRESLVPRSQLVFSIIVG